MTLKKTSIIGENTTRTLRRSLTKDSHQTNEEYTTNSQKGEQFPISQNKALITSKSNYSFNAIIEIIEQHQNIHSTQTESEDILQGSYTNQKQNKQK